MTRIERIYTDKKTLNSVFQIIRYNPLHPRESAFHFL